MDRQCWPAGRAHAGAHLLCEFAVRLQASGKNEVHIYHLFMTQEQLADATGLNPVHVNRMLKSLRHEGVISTHNGLVTMKNWEGLVSVGDFSKAYLHPGGTEGQP
jgi:hypothetical protein